MEYILCYIRIYVLILLYYFKIAGNVSGSASSSSVGMISMKCAANVSNDDHDCTIISDEVDLPNKKRTSRQKTEDVDISCLGTF